jgi:hypothetical protein
MSHQLFVLLGTMHLPHCAVFELRAVGEGFKLQPVAMYYGRF